MMTLFGHSWTTKAAHGVETHDTEEQNVLLPVCVASKTNRSMLDALDICREGKQVEVHAFIAFYMCVNMHVQLSPTCMQPRLRLVKW